MKNSIGQLFKYFTISLVFMLLGFIVGVLFIPESVVAVANMFFVVALIAILIFSIIIKLKNKKRTGRMSFSMWLVYGYTFIEGILLYPVLMYYLERLGMVFFFNILLSTIALFATLSVVAARKPAGTFIGFGNVLFPALLILVIMSIINLFLQVSLLNTLLSCAGVIIFSLYILYDVNRFKSDLENGYIQTRNDYSIFVLDIFLDFINLLLDLLDLFDS